MPLTRVTSSMLEDQTVAASDLASTNTTIYITPGTGL